MGYFLQHQLRSWDKIRQGGLFVSDYRSSEGEGSGGCVGGRAHFLLSHPPGPRLGPPHKYWVPHWVGYYYITPHSDWRAHGAGCSIDPSPHQDQGPYCVRPGSPVCEAPPRAPTQLRSGFPVYCVLHRLTCPATGIVPRVLHRSNISLRHLGSGSPVCWVLCRSTD